MNHVMGGSSRVIRTSLTKLAVGVAGLALAASAGAGIASADPDLDPIVNSTCTYDQLVAALNAESPQTAKLFNSTPTVQAGLRQFLAASPPERLQAAQQIQSQPGGLGPYLGVIQSAFTVCNNY